MCKSEYDRVRRLVLVCSLCIAMVATSLSFPLIGFAETSSSEQSSTNDQTASEDVTNSKDSSSSSDFDAQLNTDDSDSSSQASQSSAPDKNVVASEKEKDTTDPSLEGTDGVLVIYKEGTSNATINKTLEEDDMTATEIATTEDNNKCVVADVDDGQTLSDAIDTIEDNPSVEYAQPNFIYASETVNDASSSTLWHLSNINAPDATLNCSQLKAAYNPSAKNKVRVAVLDTGCNVTHPDLKGNLNAALSVDIAYTTRTDGVYDRLTRDLSGHGTHVAGIIGATANNGYGTAGVGSALTNNNVEVIAENVFRNDYYTDSTKLGASSYDIYLGLEYAIDQDASVINMSLGNTMDSYSGFDDDYFVKKALDHCEAEGITVVCSAGNDNSSKVSFPGDYETCLCVVALDSSNARTSYSNYNSYKDLAAPGDHIYSTYGSSYAYMSGTSMASPVVAGTAASLYSVNPNLTAAKVRSILESTATDLGSSGKDQYYGYGLVNAEKALRALDTNSVLKQKCTVYFNRNGGSYTSKSSSTLYEGGTLSSLPTAKRKGYAFAGWYTAASGGTAVTTSTVIDKGKTLYAHWSKVSTSKAYISSISSKSRRFYVTSRAVSGAKGYQIRYATNTRFVGARTYAKSSRAISLGSFTRGRYYYIQIRAYKKDSTGACVFGAWSARRYVRIR